MFVSFFPIFLRAIVLRRTYFLEGVYSCVEGESMPDHPEALSNRLKKLALVNQKNSSLDHKNLASEVVRTITLARLSTRCSLEGPIGVDGSQLFRCRRLSYPALEVRSELLVFWKGLHRIINPVICHTDRDKALSVGKGTDG